MSLRCISLEEAQALREQATDLIRCWLISEMYTNINIGDTTWLKILLETRPVSITVEKHTDSELTLIKATDGLALIFVN